jgi:hypothetical protein
MERGIIAGVRVFVYFLYADDIIPQLAQGRAGGIRHVCCSCLTAGAPATIDAIVQGGYANTRVAGRPPSGRCRCCGAAFCARHTRDAASQAKEMAALICGNGWSEIVTAPQAESLCSMCTVERMQYARKEVIGICDSQPGIKRHEWFHPESPRYRLTGLLRRLIYDDSDGADRARRKARTIADHISRALEIRTREREKNPAPCGKIRLLSASADVLGHYPLASYTAMYRVIPRIV